MQLTRAYPGTTPDYWMGASDELLVTALDELDAAAHRAPAPRTRGRARGRPLR